MGESEREREIEEDMNWKVWWWMVELESVVVNGGIESFHGGCGWGGGGGIVVGLWGWEKEENEDEVVADYLCH